MTLDRLQQRPPTDPRRHEYRLQVSRIQIQELRIHALKESLMQSIGTFVPSKVEEKIHAMKGKGEWLSYDRPKLTDRHLSGKVDIGVIALRENYELIAPGVTAHVMHVLFDLLDGHDPWTLPRVWECMKKLPAPITSKLFHSSESEGALRTERRQLDLHEIHKLGKRLSTKDHLALLVSLFREQQAVGNSQKCLELQWAIEDTMTFRGLSYEKRDEMLLLFALHNSVLAISWSNSVFMSNLATITARLVDTLKNKTRSN